MPMTSMPYYLTGVKNQKLNLPHFPTDDQEVRLVKDFARDHGLTTFADEKASIVELKSSWIELPHEKDYNQYISIVADVPKFEHVNDTHWHQKGWRRGVKLAMV